MGTFNALLATYFQYQQTAVIKTSTIPHLNHLDCFPVNCYTNKFHRVFLPPMTRFTQSITLWRFTFSIIAHLYLRHLGSRAPMWGLYYIKWILLFFSISLQRSELSRSNSYLNMSSLRAMLWQKHTFNVASRYVTFCESQLTQ